MSDDGREERGVEEVRVDGFEAMKERKDGVEARREESLRFCEFLLVRLKREARLDLEVSENKWKSW